MIVQTQMLSGDTKTEVPYSEPHPGILELRPLSRTFPPNNSTNCFIIGDPGHPKLIIDPSPKNDTEYDKLIFTLKKLDFNYTDIFITHSHLDHHERAPILAHELAIPITLSKDSYQRILARRGQDYFKGSEVKFACEGDTLTRWAGIDINVFEVPGHDMGQLALAPGSMEWFIAGDLAQRNGAVAIRKKDGNMKKYFESLQRIIRLNPKLILSSHGKPINTDLITKTLQKRIQREQQVLKLYKEGKTPRQIVEIIYHNVNKRILPLALNGIDAHIEKLVQDRKI